MEKQEWVPSARPSFVAVSYSFFIVGYTVHGAKPHVRTLEIPLKLYSLGIRTALSLKFRQGRIRLVDSFALHPSVTTKSQLKEILEGLGLTSTSLLFLRGESLARTLELSTKKRRTLLPPIEEGGKTILNMDVALLDYDKFTSKAADPLLRLSNEFTKKHGIYEHRVKECTILVASPHQISVGMILDPHTIVMDLDAVRILEQTYGQLF